MLAFRAITSHGGCPRQSVGKLTAHAQMCSIAMCSECHLVPHGEFVKVSVLLSLSRKANDEE